MKSPGVIYRRYRQLKRKLLYDAVVEARQTCHANCFYGRMLEHDGHGGFTFFSACGYNFDLYNEKTRRDLPLCTCPAECNAFVNRWSRDKVEAQFEADMADWKKKLEKYPELVALEWVLDKDLTDAIKSPGMFGRMIVSVIMALEGLLKYVNNIGKDRPAK